MTLVLRALALADRLHAGHKRKYTGEPYVNHLREVALLVSAAGLPPVAVAAALLHDSIEDVDATRDSLTEALGPGGREVADLVWEVTDLDERDKSFKRFNRATRKEMMRDSLAKATYNAKSIKLADTISNSRDVADHDPKFAVQYLKEMEALLPALADGSTFLYALAKESVARGKHKLEIV